MNGRSVALSDGLEEEDGGTDGDVERVEPAQHGDADMCISGTAPHIGESSRLGAHHDSGSLAHVGVVIEMRVLQLGGQDANVMLFQEADALVAGAGHARYGEDGTDGATDKIGIVEVGQGVAHDDGIGLSGIGRAQDGTQIAGLLDALQHYIQRIVLLGEVAEC